MRIPLPQEFGERAREILAGRATPARPRDAATVVLLRDAPLEVYLLRRKATMAFAAGAYVFPGGSVDPRDSDRAVAWAGPSPAEWAAMLGSDEATARGLVCAAVRETFEESGVLLAGPDPATVVADTTGDDWEADRLALIGRTLSFAEFLDRRGLVLRADLLKAWAHWITPEIEPRRYDTRFFVAALPPGQRTRHVGGEADRVVWLSPRSALDAAMAGEVFLMPPTSRTLLDISAFDAIDEVFAAERRITTVQPAAAEVDGRLVLVFPDGNGPGIPTGPGLPGVPPGSGVAYVPAGSAVPGGCGARVSTDSDVSGGSGISTDVPGVPPGSGGATGTPTGPDVAGGSGIRVLTGSGIYSTGSGALDAPSGSGVLPIGSGRLGGSGAPGVQAGFGVPDVPGFGVTSVPGVPTGHGSIGGKRERP